MPAYSNKCILDVLRSCNSANPLNSLEAASVNSYLGCFTLFSILNAYLGVFHTWTHNQWCLLSQVHYGLLRNAKALKWWSGAHLCDQCVVFLGCGTDLCQRDLITLPSTYRLFSTLLQKWTFQNANLILLYPHCHACGMLLPPEHACFISLMAVISSMLYVYMCSISLCPHECQLHEGSLCWFLLCPQDKELCWAQSNLRWATVWRPQLKWNSALVKLSNNDSMVPWYLIRVHLARCLPCTWMRIAGICGNHAWQNALYRELVLNGCL